MTASYTSAPMPDARDSPLPGPRTAIVAGATGLVGRALVRALLGGEAYEPVVTLARSDAPAQDARHRPLMVDYDQLPGLELPMDGADVFCALGTTMKVAGSREAFRRVDFTYVVRLAAVAATGGARSFSLVSAFGADPASRIFYNRVKGEAERAVAASGVPVVHVFRPSLLQGERTIGAAGRARRRHRPQTAVAPAARSPRQRPPHSRRHRRAGHGGRRAPGLAGGRLGERRAGVRSAGHAPPRRPRPRMTPTSDPCASPQYVLKVFHEEPAALGATGNGGDSAEAFLMALAAAPRYHRLYLAGSVEPREGHAEATGLSTLPAAMWRPALAAALERSPEALADLIPGAWRVMRGNGSSGGPEELGSHDSPTRLAALRALLDAGCAVLHAEPAPDGFDLSVFSPHPLRDRFLAALPLREAGQRRFAAPFRALRSEAKFYFERWGDRTPPPGLVEI